MTRLLRWCLNLLAAASALLFAAVVVLWVRSYRSADELSWPCDRGWRSVRSARGDVEVAVVVADGFHRTDYPSLPRYLRDEAGPPINWLQELGGSWDDVDRDWEWLGFAWHEKRNARQGSLYGEGYAPFWCLAAVTAALPLARAGRRLRSALRFRRRRRRGCCPACNYDLRATPGRCPECGAEGAQCTVSAAGKSA